MWKEEAPEKSRDEAGWWRSPRFALERILFYCHRLITWADGILDTSAAVCMSPYPTGSPCGSIPARWPKACSEFSLYLSAVGTDLVSLVFMYAATWTVTQFDDYLCFFLAAYQYFEIEFTARKLTQKRWEERAKTSFIHKNESFSFYLERIGSEKICS
jgi:hypothetical protein